MEKNISIEGNAVNSKEYWDKRFVTDWQDFSGSDQTRFLGEIACKLMPEWFVREIRENKYRVCDVGCALGEATDCLSRFLNVPVDGMDFSEEAILAASQKYSHLKFQCYDLTKEYTGELYNVVFCSNVLEHFYNPWEIFGQLAKISKRYIVLQIPFREVLDIDEHFYKFDINNIPISLQSFHLVYLDVVDGAKIDKSYYPDKQIMLIYSNNKMDLEISHLDCIALNLLKLEEDVYDEIVAKNKQLECNIQELQNSVAKSERVCDQLRERNLELIDSNARLQYRMAAAEQEILLVSELKIYQFAHLLYRIKYQAFSRSKEERKQFRRWLLSKIKTGLGDNDHRYNPIFRIMDQLKRNANKKVSLVNGEHENEDSEILSSFLKDELNKEYSKYDVLVFSVIDYDFRYQRPQQIADHFAQKGHRVFYIDADFINSPTYQVEQKKKNLHIVKLPNKLHPSVYSTNFTDEGIDLNKTLDKLLYEYGVRDALIIADYPTWIKGMEYLKDTYGFPIITDYMDDFTGFDNAQDAFIEEACKKLLTVSDYVVASSQYLVDIAQQYNKNVEAIRNGTEFDHFHSAYQKKSYSKERAVIGYYGAIAHWFAFDKIEYLAKNLPDVDIVLIGAVTETNHRLKKYSNIKLLGEKPYKDLPEYVKDFDVCLIPFDASTNLIKATNPVKFYEYLSAGKKIVATEIPELVPFKDKYVYLSNDNETFLHYVKLCLEKKDTLVSEEQCFDFAKMNDWSERVSKFEETANRIFPKVSIVVLCYNQLDYTKECVESILKNTAYPNYELILVDNNSNDNTAEYLKRLGNEEDKVKIVLNKTNRGFAGGNNDGIQISTGEYVVLLNNDTVITRGWLTNLVKRFSNEEKLGIVGPVTNSIGNEAQIPVQYDSIADMPAFAYQYTMEHMNQEYSDIQVLAMFCVMIRRSMMDEIGLLDENYGVGMFEDDDYSMAAKRAGYTIRLIEDAFIHHYGSVSFKKLEDEKYRALFEENKKYYETKWNVKWSMHHYRKD